MSFKYEKDWFSRLVGDNGLLSYNKNINNGLYVCKQTKQNNEIYRYFKKFDTIVSFYDYMLKTQKYDRCFFEVILGEQYQKPYFDIDIDKKLPDLGHSLVLEVKKSILYDKRISEKDILVYSSHGENKSSYHIIINNWCTPDNYTNKMYCNNIIDRIPDDFEYKKYIDTLVYKSVQQLRILGSTKLGHDRFKKIEYESKNIVKDRPRLYKDLFNSLVTATKSCKILCYKEKIKSVWNVDSQKDLTSEDISNISNLDIIKDGLFEPQDPSGRIIPLKRLKQSYCEICERNHENENPFLTIDNSSRIYFHCRRSKGKSLLFNPLENKQNKFSFNKFYGK